MASRIGTPLPREFVVPQLAYITAGVGAISIFTAWKGMHGWELPVVVFGIAAAILALPNLRSPGREFVQIDDEGVSVETKKGIEHVVWQELERVRIVTTDKGPFVEDIFFVLEAAGGKGCVVPHHAAVRTKLLEELQSRLSTVSDEKVIEAMGCASNNSFTIWEKASAGAV
jgi:hypothetical protein